MAQFNRIHGIVLALAMTLVVAGPLRAADWSFDGAARVVAISDIHGAHGAMVRTLQSASVIDDALAWSAGGTHLVIVGDILDRGPDSRQVMDLLMRLEEESASAGGRVHVLIGNHEAMNLTGDLRYVSREEYAAFGAEESAADRERWFQAYTAQRGADGAATEEAARRAFDEQFPPGFFAHREAFRSDGQYGSWLLSKPIMVVIDGTAYVHGGVSPMIAEIGLAGVNGRLHGELADYVRKVEALIDAGLLLPTDSFYDHPKLLQNLATTLTADADIAATVTDVLRLNNADVHAANGPLWYRGNVACSEVIEEDRLEASLAAIGAKRVVIGHTPTRGRRVLERFDNRVIEIDTGILNSFYEGHGSALVGVGERFSVVTESGEQIPEPVSQPRYVGKRPAGLDTAALEALLATGNIVADRSDALGRRIVTVSDGNLQVDAEFVKRAGRGFYPEVAAYRLDRMLELDAVPVAVMRELEGKEGSLQFLPDSTTNEEQRRETGSGGSAMCPLPEQWQAMLVFDALIFNEGRVATTIQYDRATWQLILVGHSRAFTTSKGRPRHLAEVPLEIGSSWAEALASLTDTGLEEWLGDVLDGRRMRALAARRDELLKLH
ncbi:MAG: metallophosphoesterase [Gammaproteobacteria bacterium]|nr:metallophosphoesterase [Gammaproteobacteria bacterium]